MRDKRGYVPGEWMDEMPPTQGEHPDAFLERRPEGLVLRPILGPHETAADYELLAIPQLTNGQDVLFMWHEIHGSRTVTVRGAADFSISAPFEETTNCFSGSDSDYEDIWDSVGELVNHLLTEDEQYAGRPLPFDIDVDGWAWQDQWFRLTILESGAGHFEPSPLIGRVAAFDRIAAERKRQIEVEHFEPSRDRVLYPDGQLLKAAYCYMLYGDLSDLSLKAVPSQWPWMPDWWKPGTPQRNLERAGALCMAEIYRLDPTNDADASRSLEQAVARLAELPA